MKSTESIRTQILRDSPRLIKKAVERGWIFVETEEQKGKREKEEFMREWQLCKSNGGKL